MVDVNDIRNGMTLIVDGNIQDKALKYIHKTKSWLESELKNKKLEAKDVFYAFYKKNGTSENGNEIYAKTYVAAIEVSGYKSYFKKQKDNHQNFE